jgi:hypothetical protein
VKTLHFMVTVPNIPEGMEDEEVRDWLWDSLLHPYDAAYEASVTVEPIPALDAVVAANPERQNNGCMCHQVQCPISPGGRRCEVDIPNHTGNCRSWAAGVLVEEWC